MYTRTTWTADYCSMTNKGFQKHVQQLGYKTNNYHELVTVSHQAVWLRLTNRDTNIPHDRQLDLATQVSMAADIPPAVA